MTVCLGFLLLKNPGARLWALAFFSTAVAAFVGGTSHGFPALYPDLLWKTTLVAAGIASWAMVTATGKATRIYPRSVEWLASIKLWIYLFWMFAISDAFIVVVVDSGIALLAVALLHAVRGDAPWRWMIAGVAVSVVAAGVQAMHLAPHPQFNHNDLYHVIQVAAMCLFYRGAKVIPAQAGI